MGALNTVYKHEIANALRAAAAANLGTTTVALDALQDIGTDLPQEAAIRVYRLAFLQALFVIGLAFGLEPSEGATIKQIARGQAALPSWGVPRKNGL